MRRIRLLTREEAFKRAEHIMNEYRAAYGIDFEIEHSFLPVELLVPTQAELSEVNLPSGSWASGRWRRSCCGRRAGSCRGS